MEATAKNSEEEQEGRAHLVAAAATGNVIPADAPVVNDAGQIAGHAEEGGRPSEPEMENVADAEEQQRGDAADRGRVGDEDDEEDQELRTRDESTSRLRSAADEQMNELPALQDKFAFARAIQAALRRAVLDQMPKFLFEDSASGVAPQDCSPQQWLDYLSQVHNCMPVQHVVVDFDQKCAYDWETRSRAVGGDLSRLPNLWNALAARLDPYPHDINKKFDWYAYICRGTYETDDRAAGDPDEDAKTEWLNSQYYHSLALFMPASTRADPWLCSAGNALREYPAASALAVAYVRADVTARHRLERIGVTTRLGRPTLFPNTDNYANGQNRDLSKWRIDLDFSDELDDLDEENPTADQKQNALSSLVLRMKKMHGVHLGPPSDGDMAVDEVVNRDTTGSRHNLVIGGPVREDARVIYWTLVEQLLRFPFKVDSVKQSLAEMARTLEPKARKKRTTVIHQHGHTGAVLRMAARAQDYALLQTRARGLLEYVDLFQVDINFQLRRQEGTRVNLDAQPETETIMTHVADVPAVVVALMKHGAKPPTPAGTGSRSLAEIAQNTQNIHASECTAALVALSDAATSFLWARGVDLDHEFPKQAQPPPAAGAGASSAASSGWLSSTGGSTSSSSSSAAALQAPPPDRDKFLKPSCEKIKISSIVDELRTRIKQLSLEDLASLRKAEKHAQSLSSDDIATALSNQLNRVVHANEAHPHPNRNGKKALLLVRNFVALKYPDEDADFLILRALCQAAHQYGPNRGTCDPVLLVVNVLTGRVTDADVEEAAQRRSNLKDDEHQAAERCLTIPRNFLAQLQELHGAKTWHIVKEGQRRLGLLRKKDRRLLPGLFEKVVGLESIEYATNRLRGLFVQQIMQDLDSEDALEVKYGDELDDLPNMPRELGELLVEVYEIADKFTKLFLSGDHMQEAFAPFISTKKIAKRAGEVSGSAQAEAGGGSLGKEEGPRGDGESDAKRQKVGLE
eukprot:g6309.t1